MATQETHTGKSSYSLLLKGATLLDPGQGIHDRRDVAFKDGRVAAVGESIDSAQAERVLDVTGKLVTPGLIDLHGHFYHGGTLGSTDPDVTCLSAGATTGVDAGSAGWTNYRAMRDYVLPAKATRLLAYVHIAASGLLLMRTGTGGELQDMRSIDPDRTAEAIMENAGFLVGVKVRISVDAVASWNAQEALVKSREAADKAGVGLMVHIAGTPLPLSDILDVLKPGDVVTHVYNGREGGILDRDGRVKPEVRDAAERGVIMDVAHAGIHCNVDVATAALQQGFAPTTISTDMHNPPPGRVVYGMNDLVSKFHAMGEGLEDAIAAATIRPAKALHLEKEIGSLAPGMVGDAAVFDQREGRFVWQDAAGHTVDGKLRLDTFLTIRDGAVVWREGRLDHISEC